MVWGALPIEHREMIYVLYRGDGYKPLAERAHCFSVKAGKARSEKEYRPPLCCVGMLVVLRCLVR